MTYLQKLQEDYLLNNKAVILFLLKVLSKKVQSLPKKVWSEIPISKIREKNVAKTDDIIYSWYWLTNIFGNLNKYL